MRWLYVPLREFPSGDSLPLHCTPRLGTSNEKSVPVNVTFAHVRLSVSSSRLSRMHDTLSLLSLRTVICIRFGGPELI